MYTHRGATLNALGEIVAHRLERDSVFLWTLPLFHCNGWCFPWAVTAAGGTHVMLRARRPGADPRSDRAPRASPTSTARPTVLLMLAEAPEAQGVRFDPPIRVATGGSPPSPTLLARMEQLGVDVTHLYGLTETYGPHVYCEMQPGWERLDVDGRAARDGAPGRPLPHGHPPARRRRRDARRSRRRRDHGRGRDARQQRDEGLLRRSRGDRRRPSRGGWFHSGDLGVVHPDGYIELRDRKKDIIISGGENISTIEVEHTHRASTPAVLECAVVAIPDEKWGEVPKAFVSLKPGRARRASARSSTSAASASPTSSAPRRSSSASSRRPRRARSRSSSCASGSGRGSTSARSTESAAPECWVFTLVLGRHLMGGRWAGEPTSGRSGFFSVCPGRRFRYRPTRGGARNGPTATAPRSRGRAADHFARHAQGCVVQHSVCESARGGRV